MSYVKTFLPELSELKDRIQTNPDILRYYSKYEGVIGSSESIDYLTQQIEKYYDNKENTF
jgi:hypothetical protein